MLSVVLEKGRIDLELEKVKLDQIKQTQVRDSGHGSKVTEAKEDSGFQLQPNPLANIGKFILAVFDRFVNFFILSCSQVNFGHSLRTVGA